MEEKGTYGKREIELKPCPWCGTLPTMRRISTGLEHGDYVVWFAVECDKCHIQFKAPTVVTTDCDGRVRIIQEGYSEALNQWNRRANDDDGI